MIRSASFDPSQVLVARIEDNYSVNVFEGNALVPVEPEIGPELPFKRSSFCRSNKALVWFRLSRNEDGASLLDPPLLIYEDSYADVPGETLRLCLGRVFGGHPRHRKEVAYLTRVELRETTVILRFGCDCLRYCHCQPTSYEH